ncbi:unnamed protein product [Effrenium voratum]|nr:unnamed protein product [Effrenium voratum]
MPFAQASQAQVQQGVPTPCKPVVSRRAERPQAPTPALQTQMTPQLTTQMTPQVSQTPHTQTIPQMTPPQMSQMTQMTHQETPKQPATEADLRKWQAVQREAAEAQQRVQAAEEAAFEDTKEPQGRLDFAQRLAEKRRELSRWQRSLEEKSAALEEMEQKLGFSAMSSRSGLRDAAAFAFASAEHFDAAQLAAALGRGAVVGEGLVGWLRRTSGCHRRSSAYGAHGMAPDVNQSPRDPVIGSVSASKPSGMYTAPKPLASPPGSVEVRFPRQTTFPGNALQVFSELLFTSYFFFWPAGVLVWLGLSPWALGTFSWKTLWSFSALYTLQLFAHRPHLNKGWYYQWLLYGPLTDFVLHYHDATVIREGPAPDPKGRYLFAMYPHGVYGVCRAFSGGMGCWRALFPGITSRWGSFGAAFFLPGIREMSLCSGCIDASKPILERALKRGENVSLLPGGIDEMNLTDGDSKDTKLVMTDRKGFVKLSIENGLDIVPGFCFGEKWIHHTIRLPPFFQSLLRPLRMSGTLLRGRGCSLMGFLDPPLGFVWGQPIKVKQQKPVDEKYLDQVHQEVAESVRDIFNRHKARFGYAEDETLSFVSSVEAKEQISPKKKYA